MEIILATLDGKWAKEYGLGTLTGANLPASLPKSANTLLGRTFVLGMNKDNTGKTMIGLLAIEETALEYQIYEISVEEPYAAQTIRSCMIKTLGGPASNRVYTERAQNVLEETLAKLGFHAQPKQSSTAQELQKIAEQKSAEKLDLPHP